MTEIEQLRADLATIQKAAEIAKKQGFHERTGNYDMVEGELKQKIAELEAQQAPEDEWADAKAILNRWCFDRNLSGESYRVFIYVCHLQAKVAELEHELRCERIDGGKVRDDQKAIDAAKNRAKNREKLAELTTIANAIPPGCGLARELVERRIEGVKKEIQNNGN